MASAETASVTAEKTMQAIKRGMQEMNRPELLRKLGLPWDTTMVVDIEGLHPVTLYQKSTLHIESWKVPFLNKGAAGECCTGASLARFGHKTVAVKCFDTNLAKESSVCAHCEQLWSLASDENVYEVTEDMDAARERYKKGERRAMKNWQGMRDLPEFYSDQIQIIKDVVAGSRFAVANKWPNVSVDDAQRALLQDAGVLFADAGRSRNPYSRTSAEQVNIANYIHAMLKKYLAVRVTVDASRWATLLHELQRKAKLVQKAALWAMQAEFMADPVFVGPIVAADIIAAGLTAAERRFTLMTHALADGDEGFKFGEFSWGTEVEGFVAWAKTVRMCPRPKLRTKLQSATSDDGSATSSKSGKSKWAYGVARGKEEGTFFDWHGKVKDLVIGYPGAIYKKFRSSSLADAFVQRMKKQDSPAKWWILKNSLRDGAYASKLVALSYKGKGEMVPMWSIATAKEYIGKKWVPIYNETVSKGSNAATRFFALAGGTKDGVFTSVTAMLQAKRAGGGVHDVFSSEKEAKEFVQQGSATLAKDFYVVWVGSTTGVMREEDMLEATRGVESVIEGPMSQSDAHRIWSGDAASGHASKSPAKKRSEPAPVAAAASSAAAAPPARPATPAPHTPSPRKVSPRGEVVVQSPSNAEIEEAWLEGKKRVFSCWVSPTIGRVALSWEAAAEGIVDPEVRVTSSESNLFYNIAKAEKALKDARKPTPTKSIAERMAEARAAIAGGSKDNASGAPPAAATAEKAAEKSTPTAAASAPTAGKSGGERCSVSGVVRTKEAIQITNSFVNADEAVKVDYVNEPSEMQLFGELTAPGDKTFMQRTIGGPSESLTIKDFLKFKDSTARAWPLKKFGEFMAFCDLGKSICKKSAKPVAAANAAFFAELSSMAVRVYNNMSRRGLLGTDEFRFSVRMYMSLQIATNDQVLHVGNSALRYLDSCVDEFIALRKLKPKAAASSGAQSRSFKPRRAHSGCYLCPAADHQAWDPKFHPRDENGARKKVSDEDKAAILQRIQDSNASASDKADETAEVKRYWAQHSL